MMVKCISAPAFFVLDQEKSIFSSNYTLHNIWSNSCRTNSVMTRGDNRLPTRDGSGTDRRSSIEVLFFGSFSGVQAPGHMRLKQTHTLDDAWYLQSSNPGAGGRTITGEIEYLEMQPGVSFVACDLKIATILRPTATCTRAP
jgi:hypothetical protein